MLLVVTFTGCFWKNIGRARKPDPARDEGACHDRRGSGTSAEGGGIQAPTPPRTSPTAPTPRISTWFTWPQKPDTTGEKGITYLCQFCFMWEVQFKKNTIMMYIYMHKHYFKCLCFIWHKVNAIKKTKQNESTISKVNTKIAKKGILFNKCFKRSSLCSLGV